MKTVNVEKEALKTILKQNHEQHILEYNKAVKEFNEAMISYHEKILQELKNQKSKVLEIGFYDPPIMPKSYESKYILALEMLEYEVEPTVRLTNDEYRELVKNEFSERNNFFFATSKNKTYL